MSMKKDGPELQSTAIKAVKTIPPSSSDSGRSIDELSELDLEQVAGGGSDSAAPPVATNNVLCGPNLS